MKKGLILAAAILFWGHNSIAQDTVVIPACPDWLTAQRQSAKDYVIGLFRTRDIVILCERDHKEFTQYELITDILKDTFFTRHVGHLFTEVGVSGMDGKINQFLQGRQQDSGRVREAITAIFREIDYTPYWQCYSYPYLLGEMYKINQSLGNGNKLELHPCDYAFNWYACRTAGEYRAFDKSIHNRDSLMARNIIEKFNSIQNGKGARKKALVIMNYKHAFLRDHRFLGKMLQNTGSYLKKEYGGRVASVYIMGLAIPEVNNYTVVQKGKWDYAFERCRKTDTGLDLEGTPFGRTGFDVIPPDSLQQLLYQDVFTGLIFYKPLQEHRLRTGWRDFATAGFLPELKRRIMIFNEAMDLKMTAEEIEQSLLDNNTEKIYPYQGIEKLRKQISQWQQVR